ncbi:hypothetical protein COCON_G00139130 [Conger conger]|uniref:Uncharacterized protein n=1 Tax=Conger conger TaxID=82655 RepID=A0A9Q1HUW6_CONCO|nr:hypothetical protein COCON_G00139130 [Conger conger]
MSSPWDVVGTPLHRLHRLHQEALEGYSLEEREESLFGAGAPGGGAERGLRAPGGGGGRGEPAGRDQCRPAAGPGPEGGGPGRGGEDHGGAEAGGGLGLGGLARFGFLFPLAPGRQGSGSGPWLTCYPISTLTSPPPPWSWSCRTPTASCSCWTGWSRTRTNRRLDRPAGTPTSQPPLCAGLGADSGHPAGRGLCVGDRPPGGGPGPEDDGALQRVEVRGLSRGGRQAFVRRCFPEEDRAREAQGLLEQSAGLWELCRIPGFCWSACGALRAARGERGGTSPEP